MDGRVAVNHTGDADVVCIMTPSRRWSLVAVTIVLVVGVPLLVRARPVASPEMSAEKALSLVRSADQAYSGTVDLEGSLQLPVTNRFTDLGDLFGGRMTLRVWWRDSETWRVDRLLATGETDLVRDGGLTTQWRYEGARVVRSVDPQVRLPRTADLLPPALAARVVEGLAPADVSRLPARRVAGVAAVGLRTGRLGPQSSIGRVDLWADPGTGTALRLDVYAVGDDTASFSTRFTDYSSGAPGRSLIRFTTPRGADVTFDRVLDIADAANQYAPFEPPDVVAGLRRTPSPRGAVGVYGTGLTRILVVPLRREDARIVEDQIRASPGARDTPFGLGLRSGPLGILVTDSGGLTDSTPFERPRGRGWLIAGTVTQASLVAAAHDLLAGVRFR